MPAKCYGSPRKLSQLHCGGLQPHVEVVQRQVLPLAAVSPLQLTSRRSTAAVPRAGQAPSPHTCSVAWSAEHHPLCSVRRLGLANKIPELSHLRLHYDDQEASLVQNARIASLLAEGSQGKGD